MLSIRESLTERTLTQRGRYESQIILKSNNKANERSSLYNSIEDAGTAKELIKGIINKNKSQRKLTRLNEVRDRLKM
jgi:ribosomal protein S20